MLRLNLFGARKLSFVAASELNECGLACLASISEYFDGPFSLADIRRMRGPVIVRPALEVMSELTQLFSAVNAGDRCAIDRLTMVLSGDRTATKV